MITLDQDKVKAIDYAKMTPITKRKFSLTLVDYGLYDQVTNYINSSSDAKLKIEYSTADEFYRDSDMIAQVGSDLGISSEKINEMWLYAISTYSSSSGSASA